MKMVRFFGIFLTFISVLTASAETVIAFSENKGGYESLFTAEVCAIILGRDIVLSNIFMQALMGLPAWIFFGSLGVFMIFLSSLRKSRYETICHKIYHNY